MNRNNSPLLIGAGILVLFVVWQVLDGGRFDNVQTFIYSTLVTLPGIVIGITCHEFAHAAAAVSVGDDTPKIEGRLSLNPFRHFDLFGLAALILIGFGWGKPVVVNPGNYRKRRSGEFLVDIAGVATNAVLAILFTILLSLLFKSGAFDAASPLNVTIQNSNLAQIIFDVLYYTIQINVVLMIFNLLPIPPLDGFGLLTNALNLQGKPIYWQLQQWGWPILMVAVFMGLTQRVMTPILTAIMNFLSGFIF